MAIEHQKAVVKGIGKSRFDATRVAVVSVRFLLFYDGLIIPGHRIERVRINTLEDGPQGCKPQDLISAARAQLNEYFEGGPLNGENIFRENDTGINQDGLTDEEELSLFLELNRIEREFKRAKVLAKAIVQQEALIEASG